MKGIFTLLVINIKSIRPIFAFATLILPIQCLARYIEEINQSDEGSEIFVYFIMLFIGVKYIRDEMKNGPSSGMQALVIVGSLAVAAYIFPIINGILVAVVLIALVYGTFKSSGRN